MVISLLTAMMAVSLAACTPTTDKQKETKSAEEVQAQIEAQTTGGASDKVPDPNVAPVAIISVYHKGDGDSWFRIWIPWTMMRWIPRHW